MYVYVQFYMLRYYIYIILILVPTLSSYSQEIRLEHKSKPEKSKSIRLDKPVLVKTFDGMKVKGNVSLIDNEKLVIEDREIELSEIMMISGYLDHNSKQRGLGLALTIGAGIILPVAVYYVLGGIAWGLSNGIFVGATVLVFDLFLAYAGTSLMGIYPRRFSTMNWGIITSPADSGTPVIIPLPQPSG
jgi:hypothetical protein